MTIAHVSLDVWNTLVRPNPTFATARAHLLSMMFGCTTEQVSKAYTKVKANINYGYMLGALHSAPSTHRAYELLLIAIGADPMKAVMIREMIERLFYEHPPTVVETASDLIAQLNKIGCGVSIGSNSNFISGSIMFPFLKAEIGDFDFGVFSDLIGMQKPSPMFFTHIVGSVNTIFNSIPAGDILHVGDDHECDEAGPNGIGMQSLLITSDRPLVDQVLNKIDSIDRMAA